MLCKNVYDSVCSAYKSYIAKCLKWFSKLVSEVHHFGMIPVTS